MPLRDDVYMPSAPTATAPAIEGSAPSFMEAGRAAFAMENDVVNAVEMLSKPRFIAEPDYDVAKRAQELRPDLWDNHRESLVGIGSDAELSWFAAKVDKENRDRETLDRSGWAGVALQVGAGLVSPTIFIPGLTQAKGARAILEAGALAAAGAVAQEIPLQANQATRTAEETALSVGTSFVLGGIIGGAASALRKGEAKALERTLEERGGMDVVINERAIPGGDPDVRVPGLPKADRLEQLNVPTKDGVPWAPKTIQEVVETTSPRIEKVEAELEAARRGYENPNATLGDVEAKVAKAEMHVVAAKLDETLPDGYTTRVEGRTLHVDHGEIPVGKYSAGDNPASAQWLRDLVTTGKTKELEDKINALAEDVKADNVNEPKAAAAGAEAVTPTQLDPEGVASRTATAIVKGVNATGLAKDPVVANLVSSSPVARTAMAQIDDSGLSLHSATQGLVAVPGGNARSLVGQWYGRRDIGLKAMREAYAKYRFDTENLPRFAAARAAIAGMRSGEKLSRKEFNEQVTQALWNSDTHTNPHIQEMAQMWRKEVFDPIKEEAQRAGILPEELKKFQDPSWMMHKWDRDKIEQNFRHFVRRLGSHYEKTLQAKWQTQMEGFNRRALRDEELIADLGRGKEEIAKMRQDFLAKEKALEEDTPENAMALAWEDKIATTRALAKQVWDAKKNPQDITAKMEAERLNADAKNMEEFAKDILEPRRASRKDIQRRLRNLNRAASTLGERQSQKLAKAETNENNQLRSLKSLVRTGRGVLDRLDRFSDKELDKELDRLLALFNRTADIADRGDARIERMWQGEPDLFRMYDIKELQANRMERQIGLAERIADARDLGRDAVRSLLDDELNAMVERVQRLNSRRALRHQKLLEDAEKLDPAEAARRVKDTARAMGERKGEFLQKWRENGADLDNLDTEGPTIKGRVNFGAFAEESAEETGRRITGTYVRMPQMEMMTGPRGSQLLRTLDVKGSEFSEFMDTDIESIARSFTDTMAPDIELAKKFGDATASSVIGRAEGTGVKGSLWQEMEQKIKAVDADEKLTPEQKTKKTMAVTVEYQGLAKNFEVVIGRLRHTWGLPKDPDGMGYRMAQVVQNLNVMRYMNMVTVSSLPDVARPIMRNGLTRTFRDGFLPFITGVKEFKLNKREAMLANVGTDALTSTRYKQMFDLTEDMGRRSKFEKGVEFLTAKQGIIATFNYWTDMMKQISAATTNARLFDNIAQLGQGKSLSAKEVTFLADNGIGPNEARLIWQEVVDNGGGSRVNGVWLPQTEMWKSRDAQAIYRAAINREVNNMIVTPGLGKPAWMDASLAGKMVGQFKGFGMASTSKTLLAGIQQRDAAVVTGFTISLSLGALSYYLSSVIAGGKQFAEMQDAGPGRWADEAYQRSGVLGAFGIAQDALSRAPIAARFTSFSGGRSTRRGGDSIIESFGGPTLDFAAGVSSVLTGIHDPTQHTVHEARKLLPWQSLIGVREIYDAIESAVPVRQTR